MNQIKVSVIRGCEMFGTSFGTPVNAGFIHMLFNNLISCFPSACSISFLSRTGTSPIRFTRGMRLFAIIGDRYD